MRYTLDGSDPTRDAGEWLAPLRVPPGYILKVRAIAAAGTPAGAVVTWSGPPAAPPLPSTLVPATQNRDWRVYDWTTRHREASALMRARRPDIVMLGDSITHFWGGEPVGGRRTGVAEWDRFFAGRSVVNLGYGWNARRTCCGASRTASSRSADGSALWKFLRLMPFSERRPHTITPTDIQRITGRRAPFATSYS